MVARALQAVTAAVVVLAFISWSVSRSDVGVSLPTVVPTQSASAMIVPQPSASAIPSQTLGTGLALREPLPALETLRISVPELAIDLPLAYGDIARDVPQGRYEGNTPERSAFVFPGSAPLAQGGNTYIYAHARVGMFLSLWNVRVNYMVVIYAPDRPEIRLRYVVTKIIPRVDPSDTSWLDPRGPERLTLQTSTGPNAADPRFIVIASRESDSPGGSAKP